MRVVVLYEDSNERAEAENLANVLVTLAPSLATAEVYKDGGVTMHHHSKPLPKVLVQVRAYGDVFRNEQRTKEHRTWGGGPAVRTVSHMAEVSNDAAWQDFPGLINELSAIFGIDRELVESLAHFAMTAKSA